jgi:hypothetical protein
VSASLDDLIPEFIPFAKGLVQLAGRAGVQPRVTSTLRTHTQQAKLFAAFQRGETKYPVAPPGTSSHEFGYAFDLVVDTADNLHDLGSVWNSWGGIWSAADEVHFQYPGFSVPKPEAPSLWDYAMEALDFTSLVSLLVELGYVVTSRAEAERIARLLHIDPYGHVF